MIGITPWAVAGARAISDKDILVIYTKQIGAYSFEVKCAFESLWIASMAPGGGATAFRAAFAPGDNLKLKQVQETDDGVKLTLTALIGAFDISISFKGNDQPILHFITHLTPANDLLIPFWPRDIIVTDKNGQLKNTNGQIKVKQVGTRSGLLYVNQSRPKSGSMLYFQNLTALEEYCQQTETSAAECVIGEWPEFGFALPSTVKNKPIQAGTKIVISDAYITFNKQLPGDEPAMVKQFLNMLSTIYLELPLPATTYNHWPDVLDKGLKDLIENPGCWKQVAGHIYFNAYVCDYDTPPEIMVQLAVLLPLLDYVEWSGTALDVMKKIKEGLECFYDDKIGSIMRWLPAAADKLEGEEEQKKPMVMDSWYLHHPLLNLSRLALKGDKLAEKLFLNSIGYAIKVAHQFNYHWPVFYKMDTLEIVKAETQPGKGGEKDVAGIYAHVMMQAWELTSDNKYLLEAKKAAKTLQGLGFDLFYQANNTAFSAGAMLRLYKETKDEAFLELSYLCLANIFKNVHLWDCNYGFGKNFPTFFALFPLNDAPYTAVYEEQEVFCALHDYLKLAEDVELLPSVNLLIAEYIRYLNHRAVYYYPAMLPREMLAEKTKIGELDPKLWIALEDMHDGWEPCGSVGQEVYGAGNAFGILPRHFVKVPGEDFMIYVDYPTNTYRFKKGSSVSFKVKGDLRLTCRLLIVKDKKELPSFMVTSGKQEIKGSTTEDGHIEYSLAGNSAIEIKWTR